MSRAQAGEGRGAGSVGPAVGRGLDQTGKGGPAGLLLTVLVVLPLDLVVVVQRGLLTPVLWLWEETSVAAPWETLANTPTQAHPGSPARCWWPPAQVGGRHSPGWRCTWLSPPGPCQGLWRAPPATEPPAQTDGRPALTTSHLRDLLMSPLKHQLAPRRPRPPAFWVGTLQAQSPATQEGWLWGQWTATPPRRLPSTPTQQDRARPPRRASTHLPPAVAPQGWG